MCQYLASEVHKPLLGEAGQKPAQTQQGAEATRPLVTKKRSQASIKKPSTPATPSPAKAAPVKPLPAATPPSPVVMQLMEMGFQQRFIEYAIKMTGSSSPERLINWLVDHQGMEIPEPEHPPPSQAPPTPQAPPAATATPPAGGKDQRSSSVCSSGSEGIIYSEESSSDSSEYEQEKEEVEEPEGESAPWGDYIVTMSSPKKSG